MAPPRRSRDPRPGTAPLDRTILGALGLRLMEASGERVVVEADVTDAVRDPRGAFSLGSMLVLAETAASTGAGLAAGIGHRAFGLEIDGAMVMEVREGVVRCTGTPLVTTSSRQVWHMVLADESGATVGDARCTLAIVEQPGS